MPRPVSWLPRLHEIRRAVANSVRSHYDRRDLQSLFELQPRAAQKLLQLLPTVPVGTAKLVEREALGRFLDGVRDADDVTGYMEQVRQTKASIPRRKLRSLVRHDADPATLTSLPESVSLSRGRLEVSFRSVKQLGEAMYWLAQMLDTDEFAREFEPEPPPLQSPRTLARCSRNSNGWRPSGCLSASRGFGSGWSVFSGSCGGLCGGFFELGGLPGGRGSRPLRRCASLLG